MLHKNRITGKFFQHYFVLVFIVICLFTEILSGCKKDGPSGSKSQVAAGPVHACELLTKAEVEVILGEVVEEPNQMFKENEKQQFWMSSCNYYAPSTSKRVGILIQKSLIVDPGKAYEAHTASLKNALGDKYNLKTIEGIGAMAGWDGSSGQLTVFEGQRMLIITTGSPGEDEGQTLERAKSIAANVLSKLK